MRKIVLACAVITAFSTAAMAAEIAISTQAGWFSQGAADREMQEIVDNVTAVPVERFTASDQDALADWVIAHTGDGVSDLLILCGQFPDTIYAPGNSEADGSLAELFLDDGNCIINTGDYLFYVVNGAGTNGEGGIQAMMDIAGITMWDDDTAVSVTAEGQQYTPTLQDFQTDRPFHLNELEGDWYPELILAQNSAGTRADPVIVRNSVTGGRLGIFYQTASQDDDPRGEVISEWINNWYLLNVEDPKLARNPNPDDGASDVPPDSVLSWTPGILAAAHDVYFGTSFDDVNDGVGTLVSAGQSAATFDPEGALEFGTTYYWRVDEINSAPDNTVFRGDVWSFTAEPFAYSVANIVATTNATSDAGAGPENTVNGSGLNSADQHSTESTDMWVTVPGQESVYIQYEFDQVYKLYEMWVWNYNVQFELMLGFGLKDVTVEYSENGTDWTVLSNVEFAQATARVDYTANTTVSFDGVAAKYVRLNINSGWGPLGQFGLSEVRFLYIPASPREPQPADGAVNVPVGSTLTWRAGREAVTHDVYLGTDADALAVAASVDVASFTPGNLEFGMTYYWQVDEVNEADAITTWGGDLWSFATQEFALVEDFESYDDEDNRIYNAWLDGWTNGTGSIVGYLDAPFAERSIVNSGQQSMPLEYNNSAAPFYSETEKELDSVDWTGNGADTLVVNFQGRAATFTEQADGSILMGAGGADIWGTSDEFRFAYKQLSGDGSITVRVDSLVRSDGWAKAGVMIRQNANATAVNAGIFVTPDNGISFQYRTTAGGDSANAAVAGLVAPYWVKLIRTGNVFTAQYSADGATWTDLATTSPVELDMTGSVLIGLALTSHSSTVMTNAEMSNVSTTGSVSGAWTAQAIGVDQPGNAAASLYVAVEDASGHVATVVHPDPAATNATTWQQWQIPFSDLAGVNMARVRTMYLGVGDHDNPNAGGSGLVFIDDIGFGRPAPEPLYQNLLANGGFEDGVMAPWSTYGDVTAEVVSDDSIEGNSCLHLTVGSAGANFWDAGLQHTGHVFQAGKQYTLSAFLKCSSGTLDINFKPELAADPWSGFGDQIFTMTEEWTEFSVTTPVFEADTSPAAITFHIAFAAADFWIDGVRFYEGEYVAP